MSFQFCIHPGARGNHRRGERALASSLILSPLLRSPLAHVCVQTAQFRFAKRALPFLISSLSNSGNRRFVSKTKLFRNLIRGWGFRKAGARGRKPKGEGGSAKERASPPFHLGCHPRFGENWAFTVFHDLGRILILLC